MKTTQKPRYKIEKIFPELEKFRKTTIRLHPTRNKNSTDILDSKFGGTFLWSANEACPICDDFEYHNSFLTSNEKQEPHNENYVTVLQLNKKDYSWFEFPDSKDVFQLLWCPADHIRTYVPVCKVFWRDSKEIKNINSLLSVPKNPREEYLVELCDVYPEEIIEYPSLSELFEIDIDLAEKVEEWQENFEDEAIYEYQLSVADGCKVGGYVNWIQEPEIPVCDACNSIMEHLLTISDSEFNGGTYERWCPAEYSENIMGISYEERRKIQSPLNIHLGDMGKIFIFVCRKCSDWSIKTVFQCS